MRDTTGTRVLFCSLVLALAIPTLALAGAQPVELEFNRTIRLKAADFDPVAGIPTSTDIASIERYRTGVRGGFLVQFSRPITADDRAALEAAGASIKGYVPMMAFEIVMTEESRGAVEQIPGVRWVGVYQPAFKLQPGLVQAFGARFKTEDRVELQISLFPGEADPGLAQIRGLGARVRKLDQGRSFLTVQVEVPAGRLRALARVPQVRYIEPTPWPVPLNDRSRFYTGLDDIANSDFTTGLDVSLDGKDEGSGFQVKYGHMDSGLWSGHPDFSTADVTWEPGADTGDLDNGHGTHTAGSMVGDGGADSTVPEDAPGTGSVIPNQWRGVTPQAALHHISFDNNYTDRQIFERQSEVGAHISSNSWGYGSIQGSVTDYNSNAAIWDEGVWDADDDQPGLQPLIILFSAGNDGGWTSPYNGCTSAGPDNVGSPGTAKNVITVGNNETDRGSDPSCGGAYSGLGDTVEEMNASSSRGPVDPDGTGQGLFKPDVTNIGGYWVASTEASGTASTCSTSTVNADCPTPGQPGYCSDTGGSYAYYNGTSMSCPLTAGFSGVVVQDLVANLGVTAPKPSLVKGLLINGARDLQPSSCDYTYEVDQTTIHEGWGMVQAKDSLYGPNGSPAQRNIDFENEVTGNAVATGGNYSRQIDVTAGTPLKVTLVWTDYPAAAGSGSPLVVNDLDLEVSGPGGTWLGNNFNGNWSVTGGSADRYNVVENVYLQNPQSGTYTITVKGYQVSQDQEPDLGGVNQDFSLIWSGAFGACTPTCGNDTIECDEVCDGTDLGSETCQSQGFDDGTLACNGSCDGLDTSGCYDYVCGNETTEGSEVCDGTDLASETCVTQGCTGGTLACLGDCTDFDTSSCTGCPVCNDDGTCDAGEDCNSCPNDCISGSTAGASCGNGVCEAGDGEDCVSCPADCNGVTGGKPSGRFCCGDGDGRNPLPCSDPVCSTGGWECTDVPSQPSSFCCGDGTCEGDEDSFNCAVDCGAAPYCGDGTCDPGEDSYNCPADCGDPPACGDGTCDPGEDKCSCPGDCGTPPSTEEGLCSNGIDDDCDGATDGDDTDCQGECLPDGTACTSSDQCCSLKCAGKKCR